MIVEFLIACAVALVILTAPGFAMAIAIPSLALAVLYLLARFALPSLVAVLIKVLQGFAGHIPGTLRGKGVSQTPGTAVRDMLYVVGLVLSAEAGVKWGTIFLRSRQAAWLEPWKPLMSYAPFVAYSIVLAYLYWHWLKTESVTMGPNDNVQRRFVHGRADRVIVGLAILTTFSLFGLRYTTGQTLADRVVSSWNDAKRFTDFQPEYRVLADQPMPKGKTYACFAFDFDPRKREYPVGVEARLKSTGEAQKYVLGRMEARDSDGKQMAVPEHNPSDLATREVERQLAFNKPALRKPCSIIVRVAPKSDADGKLLAEAKRDPRKLIAIAILGWSENDDAKR